MEIRSAKLGELKASVWDELREKYPERELRGIVQSLFSFLTGLSPSMMVLEKNREMSESQINFIQRSVRRLREYEPVQYVTGQVLFHGLEFKVDRRVLIPRPETEELVGWVVSETGSDQRLHVLDVGTGSGCIAISLKKLLNEARIAGIDISEDALVVAAENAARLEAAVEFMQLDILDEQKRSLLPVYDLVISNPPYVTPEDSKAMLPNVTGHEPAIALYVDADPLVFYREIIRFSVEHLREGGSLYFETNEKYADEIAGMMLQAGYSGISIRKDMQGKERMVRGGKV
jgi:release factor glutamine methyltransferase